MQRVSLRTLVLMLELLAAVSALQYLVVVKPAQAGTVWLAGGCLVPASALSEEVNDPTNP